MRIPSQGLAAAVSVVVLLAGCGSGGDGDASAGTGGAGGSGSSSSPGASAPAEKPQDQPSALRVEVSIKNGEVSPAGEHIDAEVGEPIVLKVDSDQADEIHVHSEPEHESEVKPGKPQTFRFKINRPGVYEVESHETETLILSLAVRP